MKKNNLDIFMQEYIPQINDCLDEMLSSLNAETKLKDAMQYSVDAGGKRLRPLMTLAIIKANNHKITKEFIRAAACLELIHTYSLIHDDLPEMDNDDLRRGKPTNHKVFGQAMAVLAGDALLTFAFQKLGELNLSNNIKVKLITALSTAAGPEGMVNGQVGDIQGEKEKYNLDQLVKVHQGKTGALIRYACYAGAVLGEATEKQQTSLVEFGEMFGLAFQIYDDILDVIGSEEKLGKKVHKDAVEMKNTYPGILGLDGAIQHLQKLISSMKEQLAILVDEHFNIELLSEFLNYFDLEKETK